MSQNKPKDSDRTIFGLKEMPDSAQEVPHNTHAQGVSSLLLNNLTT
jgi:hypothetical protein